MRPDYCPMWGEPCQKGCDPKCGTMNAWEALRKENERLRDALEAVRAWDIGRAMDDMTLIGAKVNFRIPERIRSKIQSALQAEQDPIGTARRQAMTALRVYISGPMTGRPNMNMPAFFAAAHALRESGNIPVNPVEVCRLRGATEWTDCMRADIKALCDCDAIALLPGWEMSQGAQLELHIAHRLGLAIGPLDTYIEREQAAQPAMPGAGYQPSGGSTQHGPPPCDP